MNRVDGKRTTSRPASSRPALFEIEPLRLQPRRLRNPAQAGLIRAPYDHGNSHTCIEEFDPSQPMLSEIGGGRGRERQFSL
jgi:hypothetical protein